MPRRSTYRLPLLHAVLACLASFVLGFGLGFTVFHTSPQATAQVTSVSQNETPTPSGLPEPSPTDGQIIVTVYFNNILFNTGEASCSAVFPVKRQIPVTNVPLMAALGQLFMGPTQQEQSFGYRSIFSNSTRDLLRSAVVKNEILYLDFNKLQLEAVVKADADSSCGNRQFLSSIEKTAEEFRGVTTVDPANFTISGSHASYQNLLGH